MENSEYINLPQPHEISTREKEDAMGGYMMMFAAMAAGLPLPVINLIASIVYFFINRDKSRFVHFHALQSLLSQIPTTVINWGAFFWTLQIFIFDNYELNDYYYAYLGFMLVMNIAYFIFSIIAAVKARKGKYYYFIFFGPYAYERVYSNTNHTSYKNEDTAEQVENQLVNQPPF